MESLIGRPTSEFIGFIARSNQMEGFRAVGTGTDIRGRSSTRDFELAADEAREQWAERLQERIGNFGEVHLTSEVNTENGVRHLPMVEMAAQSSIPEADLALLNGVLRRVAAPNGMISFAGDRVQYVGQALIPGDKLYVWMQQLSQAAIDFPDIDLAELRSARERGYGQIRLSRGFDVQSQSRMVVPFNLEFGSKVFSANKYGYELT